LATGCDTAAVTEVDAVVIVGHAHDHGPAAPARLLVAVGFHHIAADQNVVDSILVLPSLLGVLARGVPDKDAAVVDAAMRSRSIA